MLFEELEEIHSKTLGEKLWVITMDYYAFCVTEARPMVIKIAAGFKTDFCSVPRLPFAYWLLGNLAKNAGLLHDALYSNYSGIFIYYADDGAAFMPDRAWADLMLLNALKNAAMPWWKRRAIYAAVRMFGALYYKKDKDSDHFINGKPLF